MTNDIEKILGEWEAEALPPRYCDNDDLHGEIIPKSIKALRVLLESNKLSSMNAGHPDAAHGCYLVLQNIREATRKVEEILAGERSETVLGLSDREVLGGSDGTS